MKYLAPQIEKFSKQIAFALDNYTSHGLKQNQFQHIIIAGLGGSGIAGRIVKNFLADKIDLPIEVISDYTLPKYANKHTLVLLSSYSGSTEETLGMYRSAKNQGCTRVVLSTGGDIAAMAMADGVKVYSAEKGFQPRAALGYSLTYLVQIFGELIGVDYTSELKNIVSTTANFDSFITKTEPVINSLKSTVSEKYIICTDPVFEGIAIRFAQQIQENAKLEAFVSVLPEANHNMMETYYGKQNSNFIFINSGVQPRTNIRFHFLKSILDKNQTQSHVIGKQENTLSNVYSLIYELDWLSLQIAHAVGAKSDTVPNIHELKDFLLAQ